jgi:hypothetical protein
MSPFKKLLVRLRVRKETLKKGFWYSSLFSICFMIILYFSFPYGLLKVYLLTKANLALGQMGLYVESQALKPHGLTGLRFEGVSLSYLDPLKAERVELEELTLQIKPLAFILGKLGVSLTLQEPSQEEKAGLCEIEGFLPLFSESSSFQELHIAFHSFNLGALLERFLLGSFYGQDPTKASEAMALLGPLFNDVKLFLQVSGTIEAHYSPSLDSLQSLNVSVHVEDGLMDLKNDSLLIAKQVFSPKTLLKISKTGPSLNIQEGTLIETQDLYLKPQMSLSVKDDITILEGSTLEIKVGDTIRKNYGFILSRLLPCLEGPETEGSKPLNLSLSGTLQEIYCEPLINSL